jgi:NarL family two-component system response regulator LiaR
MEGKSARNGATIEYEPPTPARVVVADDHPLFRFASVDFLSQCPDLEVVGEATDGREALELCRRLEPDLILIDVIMPKMDGLQAARAIKQVLPRTIVLVMTASEEPSDLAEAIKAGAAGYVLKTAGLQEMVGAVRAALAGDSPLNQEVAMRLLTEVVKEETSRTEGERRNPAVEPTAPVGHPEETLTSLLEPLTAREKEVLGLITCGLTNQQIARSLLISASTVKHHVRQVISKLGVSDRTQAAVVAVKAGIPARDAQG